MNGHSPAHRTILIAVWITLSCSTLASASLPPGERGGPRLAGPEAGAKVSYGALKFGWIPPAGTSRQALIVSETPFDTRGWSALPEGGSFRVVQLDRAVASLADVGMAVDAERPIYWAAASAAQGGARWSFSDSRVVRVSPRFAGRIPANPMIEASPIGKANPVAAAEPRRIRLAAGYEIDPTRGESSLPEALRAPAPSVTRTWLAFYGDANPADVRRSIEAQGGTVVAYVPDHTFLVRLEQASGFTLDASDSWVGGYQPAYKLSADLERSAPDARTMTVLAFQDANLSHIADVVTAAGGRVTLTSDRVTNKILRVEMTGAGAVALAQHPDVEWIEPYVRPTINNNSAQWVVQTSVNNNRRIWTLGLEGQGQVFHHSDSGIDMTHEMYSDAGVPVLGYGQYPTHRKVIAYENGSPDPAAAFGDHAGASYHGSHTSGTVAGQDLTLPLMLQDGMAHLGKIWHSDLAGPTMADGLAPPADLNDLFQPSYTGNAGGAARISTNSWGAPVNGAYTVDSYSLDQFMWNHPDYLVFFSAGNSGGLGTIGSPASAKNCVTVGGIRNGASLNTIYAASSRGPTLDNRRKPTICAPAQSLTSSQNGLANYAALQGTSMACPAAAGATGLMREYLTEGWYPTGTKIPANGFSPSAALLKAMVVNSGANLASPYIAPSNDIGYGRMVIDSTLYFAGDVKRLLLVDFTSGLGHGQAIEYKVNVVNNSSALEVSLCWQDYPGSPAASVQLVNDLNLTVTNGVVTYKGNFYSAGFSATGGAYDNRNVEEAVLVKIPAPGIWTVRVEGTSVPVGPQPFGLCITGGVGTNAGSLALDRAVYASGSTMAVEVTDTDAASVSVTLTSNTEPGGETVVLTGANGSFSGTLPLSPYTGSGGDGTLQVSQGDVLTATYHDVSPSANLIQTATVSMYAPLITNVGASSAGPTVASVAWNTNSNASSQVYYGTTTALGSVTTLDPTAVLNHAVALTGLSPGGSVYFDVESGDLQGNVTRDDNGGQHYRLTVRPPGDLLLVYGGSGFESSHRYQAALDSLGWFFDIWTGSLSDNPPVGDLASGMRSYDVVWWQPQLELYPPVTDAARDSIDAYVGGGGRFAILGHDLGWALSDPSSDYYTPVRQAWVTNTLHATFVSDPPGWTQLFGVGGDPISAPYTAGLSYAEHRAGASGDEVFPGAGATGSWLSGDLTPATCAVRWDSGAPLGNPGSGVWGGKNTRITSMFLEWSDIDPGLNISSNRREVMRRTIAWLLGRDKPAIVVQSPLAGQTIAVDSALIAWSETIDGAAAAARTLEYSLDGGTSWTVITASAGASPYTWNLAGIPNTPSARVRVRVTDNGDPGFTGFDVTDGNFAIQRAGGDGVGPVVAAGSIRSGPNPIVNTTTATLNATVSDVSSGGSNVTAAEWSAGPEPVAAGGGLAMSGAFNSSLQAVTATIPLGAFTQGTVRIWVRGRDAVGNWGNASSVVVIVNGNTFTAADPARVAMLELRPVAPNPMSRLTTVTFALPKAASVSLTIYDVGGRKVKTLAQGERAAGVHRVSWDRKDEGGRSVQPGVYFTRLETQGRTLQRKIVTLR